MQSQHIASQALLRAERADARSVKQRMRLQASVPRASVGRYAAPRAPRLPPPDPDGSDICKWQKERHLYLVDTVA